MTKAKQVIYLTVGSSYLKDDPERKYDKVWWMDAYENKQDAWKKVRELLEKEQTRVENLTTEDWDKNIRYQYAIDSIILYSNTKEDEKTEI